VSLQEIESSNTARAFAAVHNPERGPAVRAVLEQLLASPVVKPLLSSEHFSVDGTLLQAWASHGLLERIDGSDDDPRPPRGGHGFGSTVVKGMKRAKGDFRDLLLSNQTHRSSSDPEARLFRKSGGTGAYLSYLGHCLMENRIAPEGAPSGATVWWWPAR
jgi:hypothetical protein